MTAITPYFTKVMNLMEMGGTFYFDQIWHFRHGQVRNGAGPSPICRVNSILTFFVNTLLIKYTAPKRKS